MASAIGAGDLASDLQSSSEWQAIEQQLRIEGAGQPAQQVQTLVDTAFTQFQSTYNQLVGPQPSLAQIQGPGGALNAAASFIGAGFTIGGAVDMVNGLTAAASSGAPAPALLEAFTGTMLGIAVAAGSVTAGVGAAIVGVVDLLVTFLQAAGLFGSSPAATLCGVNYQAVPNWAINCIGVFGSPASPGTPAWAHFPNPNDAADAVWYAPIAITPVIGMPIGVIEWRGLKLEGWNGQNSKRYPRPIDMAWNNYAQVDYTNSPIFPDFAFNALPQAAQNFHAAYLAAWKLNQEYLLNGLNAQDDQTVLIHALRNWNRAHHPSSTYVLTANSPMLYEASLIGGLAQKLQTTDPLWATGQAGTGLQINTGAPLPFSLSKAGAGLRVIGLGGIKLNKGSSSAKSWIIGSAVVAAAAAGGIGIWAWLTGQAYSEAWGRLFRGFAEQSTKSGDLLLHAGPKSLGAAETKSKKRKNGRRWRPVSHVQTLLFPRSKFSASSAKHWARFHGYRYGYVDTTENYHRIRQFDSMPGAVSRTISLGGSGVEAVVQR